MRRFITLHHLTSVFFSLRMDQANMWLGALLYQRSEDIYRMKGILAVQDMEERFVFQVTGLFIIIFETKFYSDCWMLWM